MEHLQVSPGIKIVKSLQKKMQQLLVTLHICKEARVTFYFQCLGCYLRGCCCFPIATVTTTTTITTHTTSKDNPSPVMFQTGSWGPNIQASKASRPQMIWAQAVGMCVNIFTRPLVPPCKIEGKEGRREIRVSKWGQIIGTNKEAYCSLFLHNFLSQPTEFEK